MKTIYDALQIEDPSQPDAPREPVPKLTVKDFCRGILESREYREALMQRIIMHALPAAVECMLYDRAYGKTVDKLEVKDTTNPLIDATPVDLEKRGEFLLEVARQLRQRDTDEDPPSAIH
jgi:hypothetical protein